MTAEEVTNLTLSERLRYEANYHSGPLAGILHEAADAIETQAGALERSTAETREAQAKAWGEGFNACDEWSSGQIETPTNPYRLVLSVVAEDPKPLDPTPYEHPSGLGHLRQAWPDHWTRFNPLPQFEQDESRYGVTPKAGA